MNHHSLAMIQHLSLIETTATFFAALLFVVIYTVVAPWWRSALGRNLVVFDTAVALTLLPSMVHHAFGVTTSTSDAFAWFTVAAFGVIPLVIVWRIAILLKIQLTGGDTDGEDDHGARADDVAPVPGPLPGPREPA